MKLNKYLTLFLGLFIGVNVIFFTVLQKYYLLLLHHTIIYCQEMVNTLTTHLPNDIGVFIFTFLSLILLVAVLKFFITAVKTIRLKRNLSENIVANKYLSPLLKKVGLESQVKVVNSVKPFAFCFGVRQPKIYVSTKLIKILSVRELEVVLLHEKFHFKNHDTLILTLAIMFESLLPFFPVFSDFIRQYRIKRELSADRAAGETSEGTKHLSAVLTKLLRFDLEPSHVTAPAIADMDILEIRINKLTNKAYKTRTFRLKNMVISTAFVGILLVLALTPIHAFEIHSDNYDIIMVCNQGSLTSVNMSIDK